MNIVLDLVGGGGGSTLVYIGGEDGFTPVCIGCEDWYAPVCIGGGGGKDIGGGGRGGISDVSLNKKIVSAWL